MWKSPLLLWRRDKCSIKHPVKGCITFRYAGSKSPLSRSLIKEMEKLYGDVNRNSTSNRIARPKVETLHTVADRSVVVLDATVMGDVAKGSTQLSFYCITPEKANTEVSMIFSKKTKTQPITKEQVWASWLRIRSHHTKDSGVDDVSLKMIEQNPRKYLYPVWNRLASGSYMAPPVKEMRIPKGSRAWRTLGIPTICDRIAQDVVRAELSKIVEPQFYEWSFAFRPNKSAHGAIDACKANTWKYKYVVDIDIKGYFDNIDHHNMMTVLRRYTGNSYILMYCERWLQAAIQHKDGSITSDRTKGTPQGGVISPLLSNLYLHEAFDKWISREYGGIKWERFADDIVIHAVSLKQANLLLDKIHQRLLAFKLELHPTKTKIVRCYRSSCKADNDKTSPVSFDFLGFNFCPVRSKSKTGVLFWGYGVRVSTRGQKHILAQVKQVTRYGAYTITTISRMLREQLIGWIQYYKKARLASIRKLFYRVNNQLLKWLMRNHKESYRRAKRRYSYLVERYPNLFVHWQHGWTS